MKIKVLVTGAAGYIGSLLCPALAESGYDVTGIDERPAPQQSSSTSFKCLTPNRVISSKARDPGKTKTTEFLRASPVEMTHSSKNHGIFEFVQADVRNFSVLKNLISQNDVIIPLAALVGAPVCERQPEKAREVNLEAIRQINLLRSKSQIVIFPMTNNGYRPNQGVESADETTPFHTDSLYTETKFQAEQILLESGNAISFRLASLFGISPSMRWDLLLHDFCRKALHTKRIDLYEGHFRRNFVHAADVADCFLWAIQNRRGLKEGIYNLASENGNISKLELARKIQEQIPDLKIADNSRDHDPDSRDFFISTDKLRNAGFESKRSLDQGIQEVVEYLQAHELVFEEVS